MAIELLGEPPRGLSRKQSVFAVHGPNAASELSAADLISGTLPTANPVVLSLLNPGRAAPPRQSQLPEEAAESPPNDCTPSLVRVTEKFSFSWTVLSFFIPRR